MKLRALVPCAVLLLAGACAPAGDPSSAPSANRPHSRDAPITHQMILDTQDGNLLRVVQRLQPSWLHVATSINNATIGVFLDGRYVGGVDALSQIPATQVGEVRYLNTRQVRAELTANQSAGLSSALMVTSLRVRQ
jgi:hypothetical protein